jgi:hypothetical protein
MLINKSPQGQPRKRKLCHETILIRIVVPAGTFELQISNGLFKKNGDSQMEAILPAENRLSQNYPNPFNPKTTISYSLSKANNVTLKIYDVLGREVASLVNEFKSEGWYTVQFDASALASGIYFYRLHAGNFVETKKLVVAK